MPTPKRPEAEYGVLGKLLAFWDISKRPMTNDREAKLGAGVALRGVAIGNFDEESRGLSLVDAISDLTEEEAGSAEKILQAFSTICQLEPDNWVARPHTEEGKGKDNTWDLRLVVDHSNHSGSRANRGTLAIDQCDDQLQAWLHSLLWIVNLKAVFDDIELGFNGAGQLLQMTGGASLGIQGALALNIADKAGYVTDGKHVAMLGHVFAFGDGAPAKVSGRATIVSGGLPGGPGSTQPAGGGGCAPTGQKELVLLKNCGFKYLGGRIVDIPDLEKTPDEVNDEGDEKKKVWFYAEGSAIGKVDLATDLLSSQPRIPKRPHEVMKGYVALKMKDDT